MATTKCKTTKQHIPGSERDFSKYSFFPVNHEVLIKYYQRQKSVFWTAQEIDYRGDREDWDNLDKNTREFLKFPLFFFAQIDGIITEGIDIFKADTSDIKECKAFYAAQEFIEVGHNETYSMLIETFIRDPEEKAKAFNAIENYPIIKKIAVWMVDWMDQNIPLVERIIAFACVEGILFSSAFASIYWIKRKNVLKGLCKANEFIARDEALHAEFAVALYHVLTGITKKYNLLPKKKVHDIIKSAVGMAEEFTRQALKVDLVGMNADDMIRYIKCTADRLSDSLGYGNIYNVKNPFDWMVVIGLPNKSNFFETVPTEYGRQTESSFKFDLDADF